MQDTDTRITVSSISDVSCFNPERVITIKGNIPNISQAEDFYTFHHPALVNENSNEYGVIAVDVLNKEVSAMPLFPSNVPYIDFFQPGLVPTPGQRIADRARGRGRQPVTGDPRGVPGHCPTSTASARTRNIRAVAPQM